jgi:hypothetical protein
MAAIASVIAQRKVAEARKEKRAQKNDSVQFIQHVMARHDVKKSGLANATACGACPGSRFCALSPACSRLRLDAGPHVRSHTWCSIPTPWQAA